jgi:hypothetical protein
MLENWEGWKRVVEGMGATAVGEGELPKRWAVQFNSFQRLIRIIHIPIIISVIRILRPDLLISSI